MSNFINKDVVSEQEHINQQEWNNPDNWTGPRWMSLYFSKKDNRTFVPKQIAWMGWTINLGNTTSYYWLIGVFSALILLAMFA